MRRIFVLMVAAATIAMVKRSAAILVLLIVMTVGGNLFSAKAQGCGNGDLFGPYGALSSGTVLASSNSALPIVGVGRLDADGQGQLTAQVTTVTAGQQTFVTLNGNYTMSDDCSFTAKLTNSQNQTFNYSGVYSNDEVRMIQSDPGQVVTVIAKPITRINGCVMADLTGTYVATFSGTLVLSGAALPYSTVAKVTATSDGKVTVIGLTNAGVASIPTTASGTGNVNADCTAIISATDSSGTTNLLAVLVDRGREVMAIVTNPGATVSGGGRRQ